MVRKLLPQHGQESTATAWSGSCCHSIVRKLLPQHGHEAPATA